MNLISCKHCGVVLDKDQLEFPDAWDEENHEYDMSICVYDGEDFISKIDCPVCKGDILEKE